MKNHVFLFVGGEAEREVSLCSGRNVFVSLSEQFITHVIYIEPKNGFCVFEDFSFVRGEGNLLEAFGCDFRPFEDLLQVLKSSEYKNAIAFPMIHGTFGEDGHLQSFLETAGIPVCGCDSFSSQAGFDKITSKLLVQSQGVCCGDFLWYTREMKKNICDFSRPFPGDTIFVKPSRQGSSVGISRVHPEDDFFQALEVAFCYDSRVIVERCISGRELEIAALEIQGNFFLSPVGEIFTPEGFYDFKQKYSKGSTTRTALAVLSAEQTEKIQNAALTVLHSLSCRGFARIDFFLSAQEVVFNEINTLPGFTSISMFPWLMERGGVDAKELISGIVEAARGKKEKQ